MYNSFDVEAIIENSVMLEILQKYKDMGLFGNLVPIFGIGCFDSQGFKAIERYGIRTPAFYFLESDDDPRAGPIVFWFYDYPRRLKRVLENVIALFELARDGDYLGRTPKLLDTELCNRAIEELKSKRDLILKNYTQVYWRYFFGSDEGFTSGVFEYDQQFGERWERYEGELEDEYDYREVNGQWVPIHYTDDDY